MQVQAQQVFRELTEGKWKPFYLILGEEPFQAGEIVSRLKTFFLKEESHATFNYEAWDGEHLDPSALLSSLDTLPSLFDVGSDSLRLVSCTRFDRLAVSALETLDGYFRNPSPTTCFVLLATKVDKRKAWYKALDERGYVLEVTEPYEREWPKWQAYFERKVGKRIESAAWECLVEGAARSLSLVWAELQKLAAFVGERSVITYHDWLQSGAGVGTEDVFGFAEDVLLKRTFPAMRRLHFLLRGGENEIKLLSILVRQFRMVEQARGLLKAGVTDTKTVASRIGSHPFFVSKILNQAKAHTAKSLGRALQLLAECDLRLKTGEGTLFEHFLLPYFSGLSTTK